MKIYKINQDIERFKFFVYSSDCDSSVALDFIGQTLINDWKNLSFEIFLDKKKKIDKRNSEFDASCYYDGMLLVNSKVESILASIKTARFEFLDVKTDVGNFKYVNLLDSIKAVSGIEDMSYDQIMELTRKELYPFDANSIGDNIIFRDSKLCTEYFVTDSFIELIGNNNITGLQMKFVGEAY
jgi:hypothetical protein